MPMLNMRYVLPDHVVDINKIEDLAYIREDGDALEIGAMTRQRDLERSEIVQKKCPLMHEALWQVGHQQTRNRGTLGGSLSHLDPAAEMPSICATTDAIVRVLGPNGEREIGFAEFPAGYMTPQSRRMNWLRPSAFLAGLMVMASALLNFLEGTVILRSRRRPSYWRSVRMERSVGQRLRWEGLEPLRSE